MTVDTNLLEDINTLNEIIDFTGIDPQATKITNEQKIKFSYLAYETGIYYRFPDIFRVVAKQPIKKEYMKAVIFLKNCGFKKKYYSGVKDAVIQDGHKARYGASWLMDYDVNLDFPISAQGKETVRKILVGENEYVTIDKTLASGIVDYLEERQVPIINCIVLEAFRKYAKGTLDEFINEFGSEEFTSFNKGKVKVR